MMNDTSPLPTVPGAIIGERADSSPPSSAASSTPTRATARRPTRPRSPSGSLPHARRLAL